MINATLLIIRGQLGLRHDSDMHKFQRVKFEKRLQKVAAGENKVAAGAMSSYAIDTDGKVVNGFCRY